MTRTDFEHPQTAYVTRNGTCTTVDEGLLDILVTLRHLGVETQYSCQGGHYAAYICANSKTFQPLIRRILKMYYRKQLTPASMLVVRNFIQEGKLELEISRAFKDNRGGFTRRFVARKKKAPQRYSYERRFSQTHGRRTIIRWPANDTILVEDLFEEVLLAVETRV